MAGTSLTIKFLCSYGGRILPRYPDGKLRYHGGHTRVLAVNRSISFSDLMVKLGELCNKTVSLRCQLPTEDLDALVCITSDEDLANLIEEYDRPRPCLHASPVKIRAFLSTPKKYSPNSTLAASTASVSGSGSSSSGGSLKSPSSSAVRFPVTITKRCVRTSLNPFCYNRSAEKVPCYGYRNFDRYGLVPNGNY